MSKNKIRLTKGEKFSVLILFLAFLPNVFPMISLYISEVIITNACLLVWIVFVGIVEKNTSKLLSIKFLWPILLLFCVMIYSYVAGASVFGNRYIALSMFYWGGIVYNYYYSTNRMYILKMTIIALIPFFIYTLYNTAIALMTDPWIARAIKSEGEETEAILRQGVGGYKYIYMLVLLTAISLYAFLNEKKFIKKAASIGMYLCCFFTIIISNYFTALLAAFLMTIIMLAMFFYTKKQFIPMIILAAVAMIFLLWGSDILEAVINMLVKIAPDGRTAIRLTEIKNDFGGGLVEEMEDDRLPTILRSLEAAIRYPITGVLLESNAFYYLGQHSHIMDTFAIWGLGIGGINVAICFLPFKKNRFKNKGAVITFPIFIGYIIIIGLNNAANSVALIATVVYPYFYEQYNRV